MKYTLGHMIEFVEMSTPSFGMQFQGGVVVRMFAGVVSVGVFVGAHVSFPTTSAVSSSGSQVPGLRICSRIE